MTPVKESPIKVLTKTEKQKNYREKKKLELGYKEYRKKDNERPKKYRIRMEELNPKEQTRLGLQNQIRNLRRKQQDVKIKYGQVVVVTDDESSQEDTETNSDSEADYEAIDDDNAEESRDTQTVKLEKKLENSGTNKRNCYAQKNFKGGG